MYLITFLPLRWDTQLSIPLEQVKWKILPLFLCTWSKTILGFLMHTFVNKKTLLFEWNFYQVGWVSQSQNCVTSLMDALVVSVPLLLISDFFKISPFFLRGKAYSFWPCLIASLCLRGLLTVSIIIHWSPDLFFPYAQSCWFNSFFTK